MSSTEDVGTVVDGDVAESSTPSLSLHDGDGNKQERSSSSPVKTLEGLYTSTTGAVKGVADGVVEHIGQRIEVDRSPRRSPLTILSKFLLLRPALKLTLFTTWAGEPTR